MSDAPMLMPLSVVSLLQLMFAMSLMLVVAVYPQGSALALAGAPPAVIIPSMRAPQPVTAAAPRTRNDLGEMDNFFLRSAC